MIPLDFTKDTIYMDTLSLYNLTLFLSSSSANDLINFPSIRQLAYELDFLPCGEGIDDYLDLFASLEHLIIGMPRGARSLGEGLPMRGYNTQVLTAFLKAKVMRELDDEARYLGLMGGIQNPG
jgi:hypothetical protein